MPRRHVNRGQLVMVVVDSAVLRARVKKPGKEIRVRYDLAPTDYYVTHRILHRQRHVRLCDEGTTWARGWEGPDVDALKALVTLAQSA